MSKGEETRRHIVAEAATIFNQHGFEGSSLAALMEATRLEKGGIYRHFSSKEEVASEAFDYAWRAAFNARMHDLNAISNSVDKLKQFIANFIGRRSPVPGGCPLLNTAIDADDGNPVLRERARKALHEWRDHLSSITSAGIEKGEIRSEIRPKKLAMLIISSLEGALMIARLEQDREALHGVQDYLEYYLDTEVRVQRGHTSKTATRKRVAI